MITTTRSTPLEAFTQRNSHDDVGSMQVPANMRSRDQIPKRVRSPVTGSSPTNWPRLRDYRNSDRYLLQ